MPGRILFVFVDGVGVGEDDARINPLLGARLPTLRSILGGEIPVRGRSGIVAGRGTGMMAVADANLGVSGRPQSGTGQTALLTGVNAPALYGRHFGPWVPTALRELLARENLLSKAGEAGRRVAFANAYPTDYRERAERRPAGPPLAARAAGVLCRHSAALRQGHALASGITNEAWRKHVDSTVPEVSPQGAGRILARIAAEADLTLFAHYDTDLVGHRRDYAAAVEVLQRVDAFLAGVLEHLPGDALLVVTSDHGNVEDVTTGHTRNPVPVLAVGPGAEIVTDRVQALTDVAPVLLQLLGVESSEGR